MKRKIAFRAWDGKKWLSFDKKNWGKKDERWYLDFGMERAYCMERNWQVINEIPFSRLDIMEFTGLKDKNGQGKEVYECDIIDKDGKVIGNQYENPTLLEDPTNLLIQGFGTKDWETTNKKAMDRGLAYSE